MKAHWLNSKRDLAMTWRAHTMRAAFVTVFGLGGGVVATVAVPATVIDAKTTPRGMPGGLVTRRMA